MQNMTPQQLAQKWLDENALILDTETTGLEAGAEIVEISIIDSTGKVLIDELVCPSKLIPAEATAIHGITNDDVRDARTWREICGEVDAIISGRTVVIYNVEYDVRLLMQTAQIAGVEYAFDDGHPIFQCAMLAYAEFYGQCDRKRDGYKWQKLTEAAKQQGIIIRGNSHRALTDCVTTLDLIKVMAAGHFRSKSPTFLKAEKVAHIITQLLYVDEDVVSAFLATQEAREAIGKLVYPEVLLAYFANNRIERISVAFNNPYSVLKKDDGGAQ
ncbi:hypothetical protein BIY27_11535 [Gibbsiella quercinecans]|uniref:3'-5' exonuclease n=1 Tax=Gibbsiella quercinecans TaxID=929813 RepID=UPI000EF26AB5|nr:3'-5' exonuclease [Gibbsiella quercinecans]RLM12585.1 hypothetical protein BIY27_11535 [Gibbsiella quercinecans]